MSIKRSLCLATTALMLVSNVSTGFAAYQRPEIPEETKNYIYWNPNYTAEERAADLLSHMSQDEKIAMLSSHPFYEATVNSVARLGVATYGYPGEALNGIDNVQWWYGTAMEGEGASTTFVSTLGQASTWNPQLIEEMADMIADEARAYYNSSNKGLSHWAPTINLFRDPRWGRADESFSEDVVLTTKMGGAFLAGFQGELDENPYLKAIATLKHYAANTGENTRTFGSSNMSDAELREYYTRAFRAIIKEHPASAVMASYNAVNGVPSHANYYTLTTLLRETFGFGGFVIGDLGGVANLLTQYGTNGKNATDENRLKYGSEYYPVLPFTTYADDSAAWMTAGGSMELGTAMDGNTMPNGQRRGAKDAIAQGLMSEETVNEMLLDVLTQRILTGEFDIYAENYSNSYDTLPSVKSQVLDPTHVAKSLEVAEESIVLLENDGILPVDATQYQNVVVVGLFADTMMYTGYASVTTMDWKQGCNATAWQGLKSVYEAANPTGKISLIIPDCEITETTSARGPVKTYGAISLNDDMKAQIKDADLVIYVVNTSTADSSEGKDRLDMTLPRNQGPIAKEIIGLNANTVVFMNTIAAYDLDDMQDENNKFTGRALLWATYLGEQQGTAMANTIFGLNSPSAHLTVTWYEDCDDLGDFAGVGSEEQHDYTIYVTDDNPQGRTYMYFRGDVEYPFGYGLTYGDFAYSDVTLDKTADVTGDDIVTATVTVTNNAPVDASEVIQVYVAGPHAGATTRDDGFSRPINQLVGFEKVFVKSGESAEVKVPFKVSDLAMFNEENGRFECDMGDYTVSLQADCKADPYTTATFNVNADIVEKAEVATLYLDKMIVNTIGEQVGSSMALAMANDKLYKADVEKPAETVITYASSDESVATVDANGVVTSVGAGVCTITVTAEYNGGIATDGAPFVVNLDRNPWVDVKADDACHDAAIYVWDAGIMDIETRAAKSANNQTRAYTVADSSFRPNDTLTKGELCVAMYKMAGSPILEPIAEGTEWQFPYGDTEGVNKDAYRWALGTGVAVNTNETDFGVKAAATVEEIQTALNVMGVQAEVTGTTRADFAIALYSAK